MVQWLQYYPPFDQYSGKLLYHPCLRLRCSTFCNLSVSRYRKEVRLVLGVLQTVLERKQVVGDKVTIADLGFVPWSGARKDEGRNRHQSQNRCLQPPGNDCDEVGMLF